MTPFQPAYLSLPAVLGVPDSRWVGGRMMDSEQYHLEGWHVVAEYEAEDARSGRRTPCRVWQAEAAGLEQYGALMARRRAEAIAAALDRREDRAVSWRQSLADVERMPLGHGNPVDR